METGVYAALPRQADSRLMMLLQGPDEELVKIIDAANIACGFHAGDPSIMLRTIRMCKEHGVKVGAHPGLQDLIGFGRRKIEMDPHDMYSMILYQVGALKGMAASEGVPMSHIKPHGELYYYMQRDKDIMRAVLTACATFDVPVYGCKNEPQRAMCEQLGIHFQEELYVDIDYSAEGALLPVAKSKKPSPESCASRFRSVVETDSALNVEGSSFQLGFDGIPFSVCIHSDMPTALENAKAVRSVMDQVNAAK